MVPINCWVRGEGEGRWKGCRWRLEVVGPGMDGGGGALRGGVKWLDLSGSDGLDHIPTSCGVDKGPPILGGKGGGEVREGHGTAGKDMGQRGRT